MTQPNEKEWRRLVNYLKKKFPTPKFRTVVKRKHKPFYGGEYVRGVCLESESGYTHTIIVDSSQHWDSQVDTLQHEFAHHLWFAEKDDKFYHDKRFDILQGQIYREILDYLDDNGV